VAAANSNARSKLMEPLSALLTGGWSRRVRASEERARTPGRAGHQRSWSALRAGPGGAREAGDRRDAMRATEGTRSGRPKGRDAGDRRDAMRAIEGTRSARPKGRDARDRRDASRSTGGGPERARSARRRGAARRPMRGRSSSPREEYGAEESSEEVRSPRRSSWADPMCGLVESGVPSLTRPVGSRRRRRSRSPPEAR
jgi:hypothetical protein